MKKFFIFIFLMCAAITTSAQTWNIGSPTAANVTASLSDGVLTISGTGAMMDWSDHRNVPWNNVRTSITSVIINSGVTSIGVNAFYDCTGLTSVTIPNSVTSIREFAFSACTGLTSITIPNSITSIGVGIFAGTSLTSVTIPNSVTSIGQRAFMDCILLQSITIPSSVEYIDGRAFDGCTGLRSIVSLRPDPPLVSTHTFIGVNVEQCKLFVVPEGLILYQTTAIWNQFLNIQAVGVNSDLASLSVSEGTLSPGFSAEVTSYSSVAFGVSITIAATPADENATVTGTGEKTLNAGVNTFNIIVTAQDSETVKTYTIEVTVQSGSSVINGTITGITSPVTVNLYRIGYILVATTTTNANGNYHFDNLPAGVYKVIVEIDEFESEPSADITLTGTDTVNGINFTVDTANNTIKPSGGTTGYETLKMSFASVYPNPTSGIVTLQFEEAGVYIVTIRDIAGNILQRQTITGESAQIDISGYPAGVYLITIDDGKTVRVVKN